MTWVRLDDDFYNHPKLSKVGPLGIAMQVAALCYCNHHLTDGFIPSSIVPTLLNFNGIGMREWSNGMFGGGEDANWGMVVEDLINAGIWETAENGYIIHDYLDYQPSKAQVMEEREQKRLAGSKGGLVTQARAKSPAQAEFKPNPNPKPVPEKPIAAKDAANAKPQKKSEQQEALAVLENEFSSITAIPLPGRATDRQKMSASVGWWQPLTQIWQLENKDTSKSLVLIHSAVTKMRHDSLTISAPRSILKVAISIHGNGKSQQEERPAKVYR